MLFLKINSLKKGNTIKKPKKKYLLEQTSPNQIRHTRSMHKKLQDYYWREYFELAKQQQDHLEEIKESLLLEVMDDYSFKKWYRTVKWCYSNHPLCVLGSIRNFGGRFNIGDINPNLIPKFSSLYIAQDKETAESEMLLSKASSENSNGLSSYDLSLTKANSISSIVINGKLDTVFDIRGYKKLTKFIKILKKFKLSKDLIEKAKKLQIKSKTRILQTRKQIHESLMAENWALNPTFFDTPSNSQIFGQLVRASGILGILYFSQYTEKECLAIFPSNFENSSSFIELQNEPPNKQIPKRIDSSNFDMFEKEIIT